MFYLYEVDHLEANAGPWGESRHYKLNVFAISFFFVFGTCRDIVDKTGYSLKKWDNHLPGVSEGLWGVRTSFFQQKTALFWRTTLDSKVHSNWTCWSLLPLWSECLVPSSPQTPPPLCSGDNPPLLCVQWWGRGCGQWGALTSVADSFLRTEGQRNIWATYNQWSIYDVYPWNKVLGDHPNHSKDEVNQLT